MEADHAGHVGAAARQFQHDRAAEAEADAADVGHVQRRLAGRVAQHAQRGIDAATQGLAVGVHGAGGLAGFLGVGRAHAAAVHVHQQDHVIVVGQRLGLFHRRVGDAHPVGHHQQARAPVVFVGVVDQVAVEGGATMFPAHRLGNGFGLGGGGKGEQGEGKQATAHGGGILGNRGQSRIFPMLSLLPLNRNERDRCNFPEPDRPADFPRGNCTCPYATPRPGMVLIRSGSKPAALAKWRPRSM